MNSNTLLVPGGNGGLHPTPGLQRAVENVVHECLRIRDGEELLVVCDIGTQLLGERLRDAARAAGAEVVLTSMDPRAIHEHEPPRTVATALRACDAYLAPTTRSLSHTRARLFATEGGIRGATLPGITAPILARLMGGDLSAIARRSKTVAELLGAGRHAWLTCPRGSEMTFEISGRSATADDGDLSRPGAFGRLPCGEAFIAPRSGHGELVVTSIASLGRGDRRARLTVHNGRLVDAEGRLGRQLLDALHSYGRERCSLTELGIGTNDGATLSGNALEDCKVMGSVRVGFGASAASSAAAAIGGAAEPAVHLDAVVVDASLWIDGRQILDGGRLMVDGGR